MCCLRINLSRDLLSRNLINQIQSTTYQNKDLKASKKTRTAANFLPHSKDMTGIFQLKTTSNFYKNHKLLASFENTKKRKAKKSRSRMHVKLPLAYQREYPKLVCEKARKKAYV